MIKDEAFSSVRSFFTEIFNYAKSDNNLLNTNVFSNREGFKIGKNTLKNIILNTLSPVLKDTYKQVNHYAIRHIKQKPNKLQDEKQAKSMIFRAFNMSK